MIFCANYAPKIGQNSAKKSKKQKLETVVENHISLGLSQILALEIDFQASNYDFKLHFGALETKNLFSFIHFILFIFYLFFFLFFGGGVFDVQPEFPTKDLKKVN